MSNILSQFGNLFKPGSTKSKRKIVIFIICLMIATILWFLNALGKNYSATVSYPVKYVNPPKNYFVSNKPPTTFDLKVDAYGFTLLRHKLSLSFSPIVLNISNITKNIKPESGKYSIPSSSLIRSISDQVSKEIHILDIQPDFFDIALDTLITRALPVDIQITTEFNPEYSFKKPAYSLPAAVKVTGPAGILDTLTSIPTKPKDFTKISTNKSREVELVVPDNVSVSPKKVKIFIEVEKVTEKELTIPVTILNKPDSISLKIFPSEIKLLFTIGLSNFDKVTPFDFSASVDYNSIEKGSEFLYVTIDKKPTAYQLVRYSPEKVEFLVEEPLK